MLVLVGHDESSFSLQISITKDITLIVHWVKDFSMISYYYCLLHFNGFVNINFNCKYPAANRMFGVGARGAGTVCGLCSRLAVMYIYVYMCMCVYIYIYVCNIYIYVYIYVVYMYLYVYMCVYLYIDTLFWCYCC